MSSSKKRVPGKPRKTPFEKEVREATVEGRIQALVKKFGGVAIKQTGYKGIPDRLIIVNGYHLWLEVKRRSGRVDPAQVRWHNKLRKLGCRVVVTYGTEDLPALRVELEMMANSEPALSASPWSDKSE